MRREDEHNHRPGDPRYWGNQRSRDEFPRDDYQSRANSERRQDQERQSANRSWVPVGQGYRYGDDDISHRPQNRQGSQERRPSAQNQSREPQQNRDWERRKQEYGYGSHNYDVHGHDVRRGQDDGRWARGDRGDYESYRRHEQGNRNYDKDYTTGFAGRNYSDRPHYGEDTSSGGNDSRDRSFQEGLGGGNQSRDQGESYGYYDRNSGGRDR